MSMTRRRSFVAVTMVIPCGWREPYAQSFRFMSSDRSNCGCRCSSLFSSSDQWAWYPSRPDHHTSVWSDPPEIPVLFVLDGSRTVGWSSTALSLFDWPRRGPRVRVRLTLTLFGSVPSSSANSDWPSRLALCNSDTTKPLTGPAAHQ